MNSKKLLRWGSVLILVTLLLTGCSGASKYALKCDINTENFGFEITGETGTVQSTFNSESTGYEYDASGQISAVTVTVNRDLVYESSKHAYHIGGTIKLNQITNELTYDITATGDVFGNSPQTCKKP